MSAVYIPGANPGSTRLRPRSFQFLILLTCEWLPGGVDAQAHKSNAVLARRPLQDSTSSSICYFLRLPA